MKMISIFKSKVLGIENLAKDVRSIKLSLPRDFEFKAGQYLSLSVIDKTGRKFRRPLSIASSPQTKSYIEFCSKLVSNGLASEFIRNLNEGDEVELFGPAGKFILDLDGKDKDKDLFFIAAGVGVAPFISMIENILQKGYDKNIILLKSSRTEEDSIYDEKCLSLSKTHKNFRFYNVFSKPFDASEKNVGHVQDFLGKYVPNDFKGNFYICGLKEMISDTRKKLNKLRFKDSQIFEEGFD